MNNNSFDDYFYKELISNKDQFLNWECLNDTIMGGSSTADCISTAKGLLLEGNVVEENGGFISCRSEILKPPLDLSMFCGLEIDVDGEGQELKFALSSKDKFLGINKFIPIGLKWVYTFKTEISGTTKVRIPFKELKPNIRARKFKFPVIFNSKSILRFQLLYSRFGESGKSNQFFRSGQIKILLRSISAFS